MFFTYLTISNDKSPQNQLAVQYLVEVMEAPNNYEVVQATATLQDVHYILGGKKKLPVELLRRYGMVAFEEEVANA